MVAGIGINDIRDSVWIKVNGVKKICPYYQRWHTMIHRCYNKKFHAAEAYKECSVCDEWLYFSNFKEWMKTKDWEGKDLDKDILKKGNKVYCPECCSFVDKRTNIFLTDSRKARGNYKQGVCLSKEGKYIASCGNPFTSSKSDYIGSYSTESSAHEAWRIKKEFYANKLADLQEDPKVALALRLRFSKEVWYDSNS